MNFYSKHILKFQNIKKCPKFSKYGKHIIFYHQNVSKFPIFEQMKGVNFRNIEQGHQYMQSHDDSMSIIIPLNILHILKKQDRFSVQKMDLLTIGIFLYNAVCFVIFHPLLKCVN